MVKPRTGSVGSILRVLAEGRRELVREVDHGGKAHVGLVNAVASDGLVVGHLDEGFGGELDSGGREGSAEEAFGRGEDGGHLGEGDLEVDLGEVGLAVGAEVFVTKAAGDLEVAVEARDHEDLLEDLRGLREGVEVAGMDAAGDEVVARAFGGGASEERGFDLEEAVVGEVLADGAGDLVAENEVALQLGAAEVQVAILEASLFVDCDGVVGDREGRGLRVIEEEEGVGDELDVAGGHVGVGEAFAAVAEDSGDGDDVLGTSGFGFSVGNGRDFLVEHDLGDAGAVAEVEEDEVAVVAAAIDPAHEGDGLAGVRAAEFAAGVRALEGAEEVESHNCSIVRKCAKV